MTAGPDSTDSEPWDWDRRREDWDQPLDRDGYVQFEPEGFAQAFPGSDMYEEDQAWVLGSG